MTHTDAVEPDFVEAPPVRTAVVRRVVALADLRNFFDASFRALATTVPAQGVRIVGPAFGRYRGPAGDPLDVEVGFPVDGDVRPDGDVVAGSLPGGPVARAVHAGSFDGLTATWDRLEAWIRERGRTPAAERWEVYVTQPSPDMDPGDLRTELCWPVAPPG